MRKKEMSKEQLKERELIVKTLTDAGWEGTDVNPAFDQGMWVHQEASFEHAGKMQLTVAYNAKERQLEVAIYAKSGKGIDLIIHHGDKLKEILDVIVSFQDSISADNYKDKVNEIVRICPETYAAMGPEGDKVVKLTEKR